MGIISLGPFTDETTSPSSLIFGLTGYYFPLIVALDVKMSNAKNIALDIIASNDAEAVRHNLPPRIREE